MPSIEVAKGDLLNLRRQVYKRLWELKNTPAYKDPANREWLMPEVTALSKFIRKLNRACVQAYGHDCHADLYPTEDAS